MPLSIRRFWFQAGGSRLRPNSSNQKTSNPASSLRSRRISRNTKNRSELGESAAERRIVIRDAPNDIECARHFGARALAVGTGRLYTIEDVLAYNPDALLPDFPDLKLTMET